MRDARMFQQDNPDIVIYIYEGLNELPLPETMIGETVYIKCLPQRHIRPEIMIDKPAKINIRKNKFKRNWWES